MKEANKQQLFIAFAPVSRMMPYFNPVLSFFSDEESISEGLINIFLPNLHFGHDILS